MIQLLAIIFCVGIVLLLSVVAFLIYRVYGKMGALTDCVERGLESTMEIFSRFSEENQREHKEFRDRLQELEG